MVLLAPFTLPGSSVEDLSGKVGEVDNGDQLERMNPMARIVYTLGDVNCHQISDRSFYLNGNQMPFCSRDLGIFMGLVAGIALGMIFNIRLSMPILLLLLVPMAVDGVLQIMTDYSSSNTLRIITGMMGGASIGIILLRFAHRLLDTREGETGLNLGKEG